mgnify:FL=1
MTEPVKPRTVTIPCLSISSFGPGAFWTIVRTTRFGVEDVFLVAHSVDELKQMMAASPGLFGSIKLELSRGD